MLVKKTLESINISVQDIVSEADDKIIRLEGQRQKLEHEIQQLEAKIADRNKSIACLIEDVRETAGVRKRLALSMELPAPKVAGPVAVNKNAAKAHRPTPKAVPKTVPKTVPKAVPNKPAEQTTTP